MLGCSIEGGGYDTSFELYRIDSCHKKYYKVVTGGLYGDLLDCSKFYSIQQIEDSSVDDEDVIQWFKDEVTEIYTCNGDYTVEEVIDNGMVLKFGVESP